LQNSKGLVIGEEISRLGEIRFGLLVITAVDRVVRLWNSRYSQFLTNFTDG